MLRSIYSVIEQTFPDWELIIIDDGSTDDTQRVVKDIKENRIKYVSQQNSERSIARNRGIELAKGRYICFLDSDDYYLPHHLESNYKKIKEYNEPVAFLFCKLFHETNEILSVPEEFEFKYKNNIEYVLQHIISTPQACIHANILKENKFNPSLFIGEDMYLWLHILLKYPLIKINNRTLILCIHEGRTVNVLVRNIYKYHLDSVRLALKNKVIKRKISHKIRRTFLSDSYLGMAKYFLYKKNRIKSILMLVISLGVDPSTLLKYKFNIIYNLFFNFEKALNWSDRILVYFEMHIIEIENLSKKYRLGYVGVKTLADDINRFFASLRGHEDPTLKIGHSPNLTQDSLLKTQYSNHIWALKDINLKIEQGKVLGIIGKNGAGKSTLLKILSKVTAPTTGSIKVKGRIASLLEVGTGFHPELTGRENIFLNGAILGMTKAEIHAKFDEIVDFSGVEKYIDTPVKRYSSGMYVRLAFAVAAHLEPEILIVDEVSPLVMLNFEKKAGKNAGCKQRAWSYNIVCKS